MADQGGPGEIGDDQDNQAGVPPNNISAIATEDGAVHGATTTVRPGGLLTSGAIHSWHPPPPDLFWARRVGQVRRYEELIRESLVAAAHRDVRLMPVGHAMHTLAWRVEEAHLLRLVGLRDIEDAQAV